MNCKSFPKTVPSQREIDELFRSFPSSSLFPAFSILYFEFVIVYVFVMNSPLLPISSHLYFTEDSFDFVCFLKSTLPPYMRPVADITDALIKKKTSNSPEQHVVHTNSLFGV